MAINVNVMSDTYVSDAPVIGKNVFLITFTPRGNFNTFVQMAFVQGESTFYRFGIEARVHRGSVLLTSLNS